VDGAGCGSLTPDSGLSREGWLLIAVSVAALLVGVAWVYWPALFGLGPPAVASSSCSSSTLTQTAAGGGSFFTCATEGP